MKMEDIQKVNEWDLDTCQKQMQVRRDMLKQLVGSLYPSIVSAEMEKISTRMAYLNDPSIHNMSEDELLEDIMMSCGSPGMDVKWIEDEDEFDPSEHSFRQMRVNGDGTVTIENDVRGISETTYRLNPDWSGE